MFEVVGQDIISGNMGFIGTDSDRLYRMGAAEKTEDITVTGNPAVLDNATGKPFKDLHIYGRSEQMTTTGAQLLDASLLKSTSSASVECNGSDIIITALTDGLYRQTSSAPIGFFEEGDQICIAAEAFPKDNVVIIRDSSGATIANVPISNGLQEVVTIPANGTYYIILCINKGVSVKAGTVGVFSKLIVNKGNASKDYEPYTGGKPSPSPDYPQEIVSAGDGGSVAVKVTGKNLLDFLHAEITKAGWLGKFTRDEEILTISAVNGWNAYWFVSPVRGKQISVSFTYRQIDDKTFDDEQSLVVGTSAKPSYIETGVYSIKSPKKSWTKIACTMISETYVGVMLRVKNEGVNEERTIEIKDFQLELGSTATAYSPYREQLLTLPTPNGLPGVPVTSGGNYTDPQGQQWICDEVDFGRGVYVKKTKEFRFASSAFRWNDNQIANFNIFYFDSELNNIIDGKMGAASSCYFRWNNNFETDNTFRIVSGGLRIRMDSATSLDDFKAKFPDGIDVLCILSPPIETPLTAAEIAAYKSLRTYRGTTIVEAEDKAGISATYKCNVKAAEKEVNALYDSLMAEMEELDENSEIV